MQDRKAARSMKPLATHGRTIHWVKSRSEDRLDGLPLTRPQHPSKRTQCCTAANITKTSRNCRRSPFPCILGWDRLSMKRRPEELMRRREFIAGLGSAAAWPMMANARQTTRPVVGYLDAGSLETNRGTVEIFVKGLAETGYVEGQNVTILYRWADDRTDLLPDLAADLVRRRVSVIVSSGDVATALAAKAATRPAANLTGVTTLSGELAAKRAAGNRMASLRQHPVRRVGSKVSLSRSVGVGHEKVSGLGGFDRIGGFWGAVHRSRRRDVVRARFECRS